ncbi:MAG: DUF2227 family putative metal-binding protein, partial [Simkaniaceae bacterium]|nr:DUF2227 family putative metal-binding protein [Simkaniaceae bacterium]
MSNYRTHSLFNTLVGLPATLGAFYYFLHPSQTLMIIYGSIFLYTTLFMSPDLDLAHQIKIRSVRGILSLPFRLYSKVFSHRGISHILVIGSLTRIIWLAAFLFAITYLINRPFVAKSLPHFYNLYRLEIYTAFAAIVLADGC